MDECATFTIPRLVSCGSIFEALNDSLQDRQHVSKDFLRSAYGLARSIGADYQCQRGVKVDDLGVGVVK